MRGAALLALALLAGCRKSPEIPEPELTVEAAEAVRVGAQAAAGSVPFAPAVVGPGRWSGDGVVVDVPEGWTAQAQAGDVVVRVAHASGVEVRVRRPATAPALGPDCAWTFDAHVGRHRDVPVLFPARTATCAPRDPAGAVVQAWWGQLDGRELQVDVRYPPGTLAAGLDLAGPVLGSIGGS